MKRRYAMDAECAERVKAVAQKIARREEARHEEADGAMDGRTSTSYRTTPSMPREEV